MNKVLEIRISNVLHDVGIPGHIKGYAYLVSAIKLMQQTPPLINAVTKQLYPAVAQEHETTASRVERAIRHAIEVAFDRADPDTLYRYFGNSVAGTKGKPTNSEFVAAIAEWIWLERDL